MAFFDQVEPDDLGGERVPAVSAIPPRTVTLARRIPCSAVLVKSSKLCVAITDLQCWPQHLSIELTILTVGESRDQAEFMLFSGFAARPLDTRRPRFAAIFADGRYATNLRPAASPISYPGGISEDFPVLTPFGAGGGGGGGAPEQISWRHVQTVDLWPLPPPGALKFVLDWPDRQIGEVEHELDGQKIRDAAAEAIQIWP
ncbi:hypothetical protein [Herbihabitans rhizosphaerae]|uniref:hypothetical protein n=1 Tax=Herbihabitans rhizosphaerae TaxID=1872711 RepID=UPI00102AFCD8|nr:hypothetical protein [Herbihabitans rhizosphaerae]